MSAKERIACTKRKEKEWDAIKSPRLSAIQFPLQQGNTKAAAAASTAAAAAPVFSSRTRRVHFSFKGFFFFLFLKCDNVSQLNFNIILNRKKFIFFSIQF